MVISDYITPVMYLDPSGFDAVLFITYNWMNGGGLPLVGHVVLFFQFSGEWWITQFTGNSPKSAKVVLKRASQSDWDKYSNKRGLGNWIMKQLGFSGTVRVDIKGDFHQCYQVAYSYSVNQDYGEWNLISNNCLHYVRKILAAGAFSHGLIDFYNQSTFMMIPSLYGMAVSAIGMYQPFFYEPNPKSFPPTRVVPMPW